MNKVDAIAKDAVDSAFKVHQKLGPGLLESAYEACLEHELVQRGHHAQLLTYLKLSQKTLGSLINFNVPLIKEGIRRLVNQHQES